MFSQASTMPSPPTPVVVFGTGTTKSVCPAPRDGFSMPIKSVCPFLTIALLMTTVEPASPASKDTTSRKEPVSFPHSTTPSPLILDVESGTGTIKSVSHAPRDASSMPTRFAFPSLISALLMTIVELASPASKDTT